MMDCCFLRQSKSRLYKEKILEEIYNIMERFGTTGRKTGMAQKKGVFTGRNNRGFTLLEMIVVVGIIAVLTVFAMTFITSIRKELRQKELDSKAQTIYVAVQRRMVELCASGYDSLYQYGKDGVEKVGLVPGDAAGDTDIDADTLCYVEYAGDGSEVAGAADDIVPDGTIDAELRSNQWHIEYNPENGSVYGVFYSEDESIPDDADSLDILRTKKQRLKNGATVGYYGGDLAEAESTDTLTPGITIENNEELKAIFYCNNPSQAEKLTFKITLSDGKNTYTRTIEQDDMERVSSRIYRYIWVMDSLKSDKSRFYEQTEHKLTCGTDIDVKLVVSSSDDLVEPAEAQRTTNSLFAYRDNNEDGTALLAYGRHLQNLDENSHVSKGVTKAVQISDISFKDDENDDADWYSLYGDAFAPIENDNIVSYDGKSDIDGTEITTSIYSLHIKNDDNAEAGLFKTYAGDIKNVTLTGTRIDQGSDVGALIGKADGKVNIENCSVYLSTKQGDLEDVGEVENPEDVVSWINGNNVGGLIGRSTADVVIKDSFASTVLKGNTVSGGLIGQAEAGVKATGVYADSYIFAPKTGGLIGSTTASAKAEFENFYAVGYQIAANSAAGLVNGNITSAKNGYSACDFVSSQNIETYSTVVSGSVANVYYLTGSNSLAGSTSITYEQLSKDGSVKLGDAFTDKSGDASYPYNLMGQGLSTYSYPRLEALEHYGDWKAEFESGKLVYFETYTDGTYAFAGANVSTLSGSKIAVGDGYALVYAEDERPSAGDTIKVRCGADETEVTVTVGTLYPVTNGGDTYYLVLLPKTITNPELSTAVESFYQKIVITSGAAETTYYYNPYFASTVTENDDTPDAPDVINVRTARQLKALSEYYSKYAGETKDSIFQQDLDIDYTTYQWAAYSSQDRLTSQAPIDSNNGFIATYNGGYHTINGISILSDNLDTGLFGTIGTSGVVRNVFLTGREGTDTIIRRNTVASGSRNSSQIGGIAGINNGMIVNCAVSGYSMRYYGYNSNTVEIGGLVGRNNGTIRSCSADTPGITTTSNSSTAYIGGFAGSNTGSITSCYSTGLIKILEARSSKVWAAGFVGNNSAGTTNRCYAATAVTASGTAESYGFGRIGGAVVDCYYLDGGTYSYAGNMYAYNMSANEFAKEGLAAGTKITGVDLQNLVLRDFGTAAQSYNHDKTGDAGDGYIYPSVVTKNGQRVHFGNWPIQKFIGTVGVFYWEYEEYGSNSGYHFSYIGCNEGEQIDGSSLCVQHDDGGVVTSYGYGYFYTGDEAPVLDADDTNLGTVNTAAGQALHAQMNSYNFVAYETGEGSDKLHTTAFTKNVAWTLTDKNDTGLNVDYEFTISPFFAQSMSFDSLQFTGQSAQTTGNTKPGYDGNTYEIRSEAQLQFINWNSEKATAAYSITSSNYKDTTSDSTKYVRDRYPYLLSGSPTSVPGIPGDDDMLYWEQTHDIDAYEENGNQNVNFTPIGSMYDTGYNDANAQPYVSFFPYIYDGQSYTVKNIEIHSTNQAIGLFGVTAGAQLKNIVMYSDRGNQIENMTNGTGWYTMGGLAGFAGSRKASYNSQTDSSFTNCTVSGYTIIDNRASTPGWGGGNVGGLVGMTNMDITSCSSVNDIVLDIGYYKEGWKNLRVGGIAGVCRAVINSCYAGGSIVSNVTEGDTGTESSACIWVGGISGGIVVRNTGKLADLFGFVDRSLVVSNCYSYAELPAGPKSRGQTGYNHVRASMSIASNGEMLAPNSWFTKSDVPARTARIYNCYALATAVTNTTDYKNYANKTSFNGLDINAIDTGRNKDKVLVYNDSTMYLTYEEMAESMISSLNKTVTATYDYVSGSNTRSATISESGYFGTVTTTEQGVAINGKYSFPGTDTELKGTNYPFPTVLTQTDVFGSTVNVHYGAWPKYGIFWENQSVTFDMFANRKKDEESGDTLPLLELKLRIYGDADGTLTKDGITICDDEGNVLTDPPIEVYKISEYTKDDTGNYYTVTFKGLKEGTAFVRAKMGDDEAQTSIEVVNQLSVKSSTNKVTVKPGESSTAELTFYATDADGNEYQIKPEKDNLTYKVSIKSGDTYVICDDDTVKYDPATGVMKVTIEGRLISVIDKAESLISITNTYKYGTGENEKLEATTDIIADVESPDFAALKYDSETSGYRYWYASTGKDYDDIGTIATSLTEGCGLFIRNNYVEFNGAGLGMFTINVNGNEYGFNENGEAYRDNGAGGTELVATISIGDAQTNTTYGYTYYPVTVDYRLAEDATLTANVRTGTALSVMIKGADVTLTPSEEPEPSENPAQSDPTQNDTATSDTPTPAANEAILPDANANSIREE